MKRAVFLDRDGVINEEPEARWVTDWKDFRFLPGVKEAIERLKCEGFLVMIVTNQRCISLGLLSEDGLQEIHGRMLELLGESNIDAVYHCPHNEDEGCDCRKPRPGMLERAAREFDIDLKGSYIVGDSLSDMQAGEAVGVGRILITSDGMPPGCGDPEEGISYASSLAVAFRIILGGEMSE